MGRVAGAQGAQHAGVASWAAMRDTQQRTAPLGRLRPASSAARMGTAVLVFASVALTMVGILLWPAVVYHVALTAWGAVSVRRRQSMARR